jgi:glucose/arabinose dehydrogenase
LKLQGSLKDKIVNTIEESNDVIFANGFGRITDLKIGLDGHMYVLSSEDEGAVLYKISQQE